MVDLIKPKEFVVEDEDGKPCTFILSKFDAVAGREIVAKYPVSALPKLGDYAVSEDTMLKLMSYVARVVTDAEGKPQQVRLVTRQLVNNHVPSWETLAKIEMAMMEYNCSFFRNGSLYASLEKVVETVLRKISEMSISSSGQSSRQEKPPTTN